MVVASRSDLKKTLAETERAFLLSNYNYWPNPSFETDIAGANAIPAGQGCTVAQSAAQAKFGTKSLEMTATTVGTQYFVNWNDVVPARPIIPIGVSFIVGGWIRTPRAVNVQVHNQVYSSANTLLSNQNKITAVLANTWTYVEGNYQTLGGDREVAPAFLVQAAGVVAGEKTYVDGVTVRKSTAAIDAIFAATNTLRTYPWKSGIKPDDMSMADLKRTWLTIQYPALSDRSISDLYKQFLDDQVLSDPNLKSIAEREWSWLGGS